MSLEMQFPRLLVVSDFAFNDLGGGGALTRQLLRGYPPEKIFWWSCRFGNPTNSEQSVARHFVCSPPSRLWPHRKATRLKSWILEHLWSPRATAHLRRVAAEVRPDRLWFLPYMWSIPAAVRSGLISQFTSHVSVWDYPDQREHTRIIGPVRAKRMVASLDHLYSRATTCDVISHGMREDMASRTRRSDPLIVHSGLDEWHLDWLSRNKPKPSATIRIVYAGSIIVPRVFEFFVRALDGIRSRLPLPVTLECYGGLPKRHEPWFNCEWMREHPHLTEPALHQALSECSWGFMPMELTDNDPRYNRYSFPNKFGTYLAAGLPLIVLAHRESSAARIIRQYPAGIFTDASEISQLGRFLQENLAEPNPRQRFHPEILRCAAGEFNMSRMRNELWRALGVSPTN